jgi:HlyD family secretion protein
LKRVLWLLVLGGLAGGLTWWVRRPKPPVDVTVIRTEVADVRIVLNSASAGEVTAEQRTLVRGEVPGTVSSVHKRRGDRVRKGELVVTLDARDAALRVAQAEAAVDVARAQWESAQVRVEGLRKTTARVEQLVKMGGAAQAELDRAQLEVDAAVGAVKAGEAALKQAQAAVPMARLALARMEMRAPFAGVLQDLTVSVGMQVTPGVPVFDVVDDSRVFVVAPMDEVDAPRVLQGQRVAVAFDTLRTREVMGTVRMVAPALGRDERLSRTLRIEIDLDDPPPLRVGMAANVAVIERVVKGVPVLPTLSVMGRGLDRTVMVVTDVDAQGAGTVVKKSIRVGATNDELTEIVSGLTAEDTVVHSPNDPTVKEGMRARPVPLGHSVVPQNPLAGLQEGTARPQVEPAKPATPKANTPGAP